MRCRLYSNQNVILYEIEARAAAATSSATALTTKKKLLCDFVTFPGGILGQVWYLIPKVVSWVRCGTWLYWFLIFVVLFTYSQIKEIKNIKWDFHSVAWVKPQGWDLGVLEGQTFNSVRLLIHMLSTKSLDEIQPNLVCELLTWMGCATAHIKTRPFGPLGGVKRSNIIKSQ